ncbi:unnamed protein product [Fraxinus pennsylvanica]|uniref:Uncharacterized protein n=1 Tax=Fraxinus pennsylvanica TaxID=56036 RepID=A0AAD1YQH8_9LAMI|nr:unnamed protein product [Fraxinus pennsylvanica]
MSGKEWSLKEKKMVLVAAEGNLVLLVELMADFGSNTLDKSAFVLSSAGGVNGGFTGINVESQGGSGGGRRDSGTCGNSGGGNSMAEGDCIVCDVGRGGRMSGKEWSSKEKKMVLVEAEGNLVLLVELMADFRSNTVDRLAFVLNSTGGVNGGFTGINVES